jgi:hypothetical protein
VQEYQSGEGPRIHRNLFGDAKLTEITAERIEQFQQARLDAGEHPKAF